MPKSLSPVILLLALFASRLLAAAENPNVVIIITDDQGWGDIGYNNPEGAYTPNLDRLANGGAVFKNHYVMPQCTPTRVAAFTGRYPGRFGHASMQAANDKCFPVGTPTLARMFKKSGYGTYLFGKWHMGTEPENGPNHHGFDYSYGSLAGAVGMYDHRYRDNTPYYVTWHRNHELIPGHENGRHVTDLIAEDAIRIINKEHEQPFFLMLAFHAPHTPLDERGRFTDRPTQLDPNNPNRWLNEDEIEWFNDPEGIIQSEPDPEKRLLLAAVNHLDHAIGTIVKALDQSGQRENTLILFSSDNGPQSSWPGNAYPDDLKLTDFNQAIPMRGVKLDVWEGGIHVPGFANWPGRIANKTISDRAHIVDWFPTLSTLIGHQPENPDQLDGIDLGPQLFGQDPLKERDLYWVWNRKPNRWALRHGDWKIVHYGKEAPTTTQNWQLFNLANDPMEETDVSKSNPAILEQLHARFLVQHGKDLSVSEAERLQGKEKTYTF